MINPLTIVSDVNMAVMAIERLKKALPLIGKLVADIKQASADKDDTTKLEIDLDTLITDINSDLVLLEGLFPPSVTVP